MAVPSYTSVQTSMCSVWILQGINLYIFLTIIRVYICSVCRAHTPWHTCRDQRTIFKSWFSPSTLLVQEHLAVSAALYMST